MIERYQPDDAAEWDSVVGRAPAGTFLHSRRFLSYHRDRFEDWSLTVRDSGTIVGVLPAARDPADGLRVCSHPGATFGGLLHTGALTGERSLAALEAIARFYSEHGFDTLRYKSVPRIYRRRPCDDDLYSLFRLGAVRSRCELSSAIEPGSEPRLSARRRRRLRTATRLGVAIERPSARLEEFWVVLEANLAERHGARPVHGIDEMVHLIELFGPAIELSVALLDGAVVAGSLLFISAGVTHCQYIASSAAGRGAGALDLLFEEAIAAADARRHWFDFGTSNERDGHWLNGGLYGFKSEFGGGGIVYEHYDVSLSTATPKPVSP